MSGPHSIVDLFLDGSDAKPMLCPDPENCTEIHNEEQPGSDDGGHHYGCECGWCQYLMWPLK